MRWVANLLIVGGVLLGGFGVLWQLGVAPGSRVTLPAPVALSRATAQPAVELTPLVVSTVAAELTTAPAAPVPTSAPVAPVPTLAPKQVPAPVHLAPLPSAPDALDRQLAA